MVIVQLEFVASELPHVVLCVKSPVVVIEVMVAAALPEFVSVAVCATLVAPIGVLANAMELGLTESTGAAAVLS
jgi:hypothetical protein